MRNVTHQTNPRRGADSDRPLVLVTDDDPDLRMLADMQLSPQGYDVIQAADGEECIRLAVERHPDVILLDMMMPGMDGAEVLTELAANPRTADIPVIFLSALTGTEDRVKGLERGAVDWISKPADPRELVARVGAAARTKARQEEIKLQAGADPVTRLHGREAFTKRLDQEVSRSSRSSAPFSVLLIALDNAQEVVDKHGPAVHDELMRQVADVLHTTLRVSDEIFRYSTDEFAAVLPDTEVGTAYLAAERCREEIRNVEVVGEATSVSVGVAQANTGRSTDDVIARAEIALFRARESGGGRSWRADDPRRHGLNPIALSEELTDREWDVLIHLSHRRTEHEIARRLGITRGTVRSHKARIRRKLHVSQDIRLSDFVRTNFKDLIHRLPSNTGS
ncbi:MAG: diguanylate cyclase [Actinobacteria bacterium]|nr:diguanylate cyclase [Actinomycetota bacterium]